ncbi:MULTISPECIES: hypothetical protein [Rhodopseudomonas]|uniref:Signal peptide protein n=1 Tax=Rhodopseudomonas palustris TaxID=1076 RepID=A0A0D7EK34_RHOPL|nr:MULTISPECIES: hypothetical protein [Rhodopseudomonas]KIZ41006.1 signal peptide protein [Rhodopseudomonas palustris]MDF3809685.1 hypothetical protein [Rhodopseudomonas sp. BAL398]WOK17413.1 hypothetical protein RBJ75_25385 [Rhodopseudomonas sp. BAL398]
MRALIFSLLLLVPAADAALAQAKPPAQPGTDIRYFTSIDGFMDGNADVILKETRQGDTVTSAVIDVCYPADKASDRRDRFVADLAPRGQTMTGTTQSLGDKLPVSVTLTRKQTGETYKFTGKVKIGSTVTEIVSRDNSDLSEQEYRDNQSTDDSITAAPEDFTEVSPEAVGVKVKLDSALDFLKSLKGQNIEVALSSLNAGCDALRAGEQTITLSVDPTRAAAFIANARTQPGVVKAGWTTGIFDMDRSIRFAAANWRDGDRLNRDKLSGAIAAVLSKTLAAKLSAETWSDTTGKLTLIFKRPSPLLPALGLTETLEVTALVGPDKPGATDRLMLWVGAPAISTADETPGAKLNLNDDTGADEEGEPEDTGGSLAALAKAFSAQRWDSDKAAWK